MYHKRLLVIISLIISVNIYAQNNAGMKVALLSEDNYKNAGLETKAALDFLKHYEDRIESEYLTFDELKENSISSFDVIWFHKEDTSAFSEMTTSRDVLQKLKNYVKNGGNLVLSLDAFRYIVPLGVESNPPQTRMKKVEDKGYGRKLGLHAFREHPVFDGMFGGAYIYKPVINMEIRQMGYFDDELPAQGKIVAVDWDYIILKEQTKLVLEYSFGKGKILAIGAYTHFAAPNFNRKHLDRFMLNSFNWLAGDLKDATAFYWDFSEPQIDTFDAKQQPVSYSKASAWKEDTLSLLLDRPSATDNYWDVATQRILIMGNEKAGIEEIWTHPFMALRDYELGIRFSYKDSIYWLKDENPRIEIRPESFKRVYKFRRAYLTEIITAPIEEPSAIIHYKYRGVYPAEVFIRYKSNFRIMWPYAHKALGDLGYQKDTLNHRAIMKDASGDFVVIAGTDKRPVNFSLGQDEIVVTADSVKAEETNDYQLSGLLHLKLEMNDNFNFYVSASNEGMAKTAAYYANAAMSPEEINKQSGSYYRSLFDEKLSITTPDEEFNKSFAWAMAATDQFYVHTPGIGKSLVAGYATTAKGWDGGHEVSGRPGYAWYFGRDAVWSAFAILGYGDFDKTKEILRTFQKFQDLNGKIYHEQSTSGFVHFDASDATPLYIILAGKYLKQSGDKEFIKESWPYLKKAIDFCFSTDTDGDHLIENTNVGHGWVEGGSLFGSHTSLYLASLWAATLDESAYMAKVLGKEELAENYSYEAGLVKDIVNKDYWNPQKDFFYHGKFIDGTYHKEPTIMPAIPMYYGYVDNEKADKVLKEFASNNFSSNWGARIVRKESKLYNPNGYHTGSVWPLYTGWTALAEYQYGNALQAYTHVMNNLNIYNYWGLGYIEEVMNGAEYKPSGVCAHQCWSETMGLQPVVEGMLGYKPDVSGNKMMLKPQFPADWDHVKVENIRFGKINVSLEMKKSKGETRYIITPEYNNPFNLQFDPAFPEGTRIKSFSVNGKQVQANDMIAETSRLDLNWEVEGKTVIVVKHEGGIAALPYLPDPKPGDKAEGFRILDTEFRDGVYTVEVEGVPGNEYEMRVWSAVEIDSIQGADINHKEDNILTLQVIFAPSEKALSSKKIRLSHLDTDL